MIPNQEPSINKKPFVAFKQNRDNIYDTDLYPVLDQFGAMKTWATFEQAQQEVSMYVGQATPSFIIDITKGIR